MYVCTCTYIPSHMLYFKRRSKLLIHKFFVQHLVGRTLVHCMECTHIRYTCKYTRTVGVTLSIESKRDKCSCKRIHNFTPFPPSSLFSQEGSKEYEGLNSPSNKDQKLKATAVTVLLRDTYVCTVRTYIHTYTSIQYIDYIRVHSFLRGLLQSLCLDTHFSTHDSNIPERNLPALLNI